MSAHQRPRLAVLLSGTGRTLQNLLDRIGDGRLRATIAGVASDRDDAFGLQRAMDHGLDTRTLRDTSAIWSWISELDVDLVVLGGYLRLLPIVPEFAGRVLNIHPALLPKYGGKGLHGDRVHAAVLAARETVSGCTAHLCRPLRRRPDPRAGACAGAGERHRGVARGARVRRRMRSLPGSDRAAMARTQHWRAEPVNRRRNLR
jgi:hypothetical protein